MDTFIIKIMIAMLGYTNTPEIIHEAKDINVLCTEVYNTEVQIEHKIENLKKKDKKTAVKLEDDVLIIATRIHHDLMHEILQRQANK